MASRPIRRSDEAELADRLRALLAMVDGGELVASTAMKHRIEGAVVALTSCLHKAEESSSHHVSD